MNAEDFYNSLEEKASFTKLTGTGISSNYKNVFEFAESYVNQKKATIQKHIDSYSESIELNKTMLKLPFPISGRPHEEIKEEQVTLLVLKQTLEYVLKDLIQ